MTSNNATAGGGSGETPVNAANDPTSTFLDRATRRLRVDRELQLEVQQELRSHIDDSTANLRDGGRGDAEARDEALRSFGDADALADQLFKANRRRIRLRAVAVWVVRLVMPAVTVALILFLAASPVVTALAQRGWPNQRGLYEYFQHRAVGDLPPDARTLLEQSHQKWDEQAPLAKQLLDRHPDDAAYFANYAMAVARQRIFAWKQGAESGDPPHVDDAKLAEALGVMAEGERREPDNAFYPMHAAQLLFDASSTSVEDPALDSVRAVANDHEGDRRWSRLNVFDEARFAQAIESFRRAARKPAYRSYTEELLKRRMGPMPTPRALPDLSIQSQEFGWSYLHDRPIAPMFIAAFRATDLARDGKLADAKALLADQRRANALMLSDVSREINLRGVLMLDRLGDRAESRVADAAGDIAAADVAWQRSAAKRAASEAAWKSVESVRNEPQARLVYLGNASTSADLAAIRRAEAASTQQLGLALLSFATLLLAAVYAVTAAPAWVLSARDGKPPRLFIGWRRVARVIGFGVVTPLTLFVAWRWLRAGSSIDSFDHSGASIAYVVCAAVIALLTHVLTRRAVAARAAELGLTLPTKTDPRNRRRVILAVLVLLAIGATAIAISPAADVVRIENRSLQTFAQLGLVTLVWVILLVVAGPMARAALRRGWPEAVPLAGTLPRSAFPVAVTAALLIALIGLPLRWAEARSLRDASPTRLFLQGDVATSPFAPLADEILKREGFGDRGLPPRG